MHVAIVVQCGSVPYSHGQNGPAEGRRSVQDVPASGSVAGHTDMGAAGESIAESVLASFVAVSAPFPPHATNASAASARMCQERSACPGRLARIPSQPPSTTTADAGTGGTTLPGLCAGATHVALGATVMGRTCGGMQVGDSPCQEANHPDAFIYVDAPAGTALHLAASAQTSILAFPTCESSITQECVFGNSPSPTFDPSDATWRLFALERIDTFCGPFSVTVTAR